MTSIQTHHPILRPITLAIVLCAIGVPAASAHADSGSSGTAQSQTATASASRVVRPNPDQQIGQLGGGARQNLRPARGADLAVHNRAQAV